MDKTTGPTWQRAVPASTDKWADAKIYCTGLSLDGTGWRLPPAAELVSLVDIRRSGPAIAAEAFPSTRSSYFWSSSPSANNSGAAWVVDCDYGHISDDGVSLGYRVRCGR